MKILIGIWNNFFYDPILWLLTNFYNLSFQNLGLAIIMVTVLIRVALLPLILPSLRSAKKMQDLQPKMADLKRRYGHDKKRHTQEQLKLYKQHGINPAAGCLPNLVQILFLIALYQVFFSTLSSGFNKEFLIWDLTKKDATLILPILAGISQLILSKMMLPKNRTPVKGQGGMEEAVYSMQSQMLYLFPIMTVVIGWQFPSGLVLYWAVTTIFSIIQQYAVTGLGGLESWLRVVKK